MSLLDKWAKKDYTLAINQLMVLLDDVPFRTADRLQGSMARWAEQRRLNAKILAYCLDYNAVEALRTDGILGPIIRLAEKQDNVFTPHCFGGHPDWQVTMRTRRRRALARAALQLFPERGYLPTNHIFSNKEGSFEMNVHTVHCVFRGNNNARFSNWGTATYDYLTDDDSIKAGDFVLIMAVDGEPMVVKVKDITYNRKSSKAHKWVMAKIDPDAWHAQEALRKEAAEAAHRREVQLDAARQKAKSLREAARLKILDEYLDQDPEYRAVMAEVEALEAGKTNDGETIVIGIQVR
jgi:hypothetical protein